MRLIPKKFFLVGFLLAIISGGLFFLILKENNVGSRSMLIESPESVNISKESFLDSLELPPLYGLSSISGEDCENYNRRPFAVMLAEDVETRPLSGISKADLVIEMPVITGGITRMMAVYQCESPEDLGSVRSARHDFIPLAMGLDAIFVHWGGSHFALDKLNRGIMDNINAIYNPYNAFYRKSGIPQPHNGFTSMERLSNTAEKLGYRLEDNFEGYSHMKMSNVKCQMSNVGFNSQQDSGNNCIKGELKIGYPYPVNVKYEYNPETNSYLRWRGGREEMDKLTGGQVEVKNIVIMRAKSHWLEGQYNDVDVEGEGEAAVYRNGEEIKGTWRKDKENPGSKLFFLDEKGEEIKFISGLIWIEVVEPYQGVEWEAEFN